MVGRSIAICIALRTLMSLKGALSILGSRETVGGNGVIICNISGLFAAFPELVEVRLGP